MGSSSVEREGMVITEVLLVLEESGRGDLVGGLKEVVGDWDRERKGLIKTINILENVINLES
jgi:hypothetical protein